MADTHSYPYKTMTKRQTAERMNAKAMDLQARGHLKEAIGLYQKASRADPRWPVPLYNLGLLFKNERQWARSLNYNRRAVELDRQYEPAWWNLGIAATALSRWGWARRAWRGFGIEVPEGDGPLDFPCGFGPIRLHPQGDAEVVWAHRIDPARAVLASIPFPESGHRWKDVVLNDGAPTGYRKYQGEELPVLDALELLEASPFGTFVARVKVPPGTTGVARLPQVAEEMAGSAEDWSTTTRLLCRACSEGRPHGAHDTQAAPPDGVHLIGIAARSRDHAEKILAFWESTADGIQVESLDEGLEPGAAD